MRIPLTSISGLLSCSVLAIAQTGASDPREILINARHKVMETVDRLPKYMCTETIDRFRYTTSIRRHMQACDEPAGKTSDDGRQLTASDRLRVDVAVAPTREMYAWAGSDHFDDRDLLDIIGDGAISTGEFAGFLANIFGSNVATFTYNGDHTDARGRTLAEFGYTVPLDKSQHQFGNKKYRAVTGYDGTFLVDPQTSDLVRLTLRTNRLPEETGACDATTTLDYERVPLNSQDFLLPARVSFEVVQLNGNKNENRAVYSSCHEFQANSTISFDESARQAQSAPGLGKPLPVPPLDLHAGLPFRLKLAHDLDTSTAAAGDLVEAELSTAISDHDSRLVVPAGTAVKGRIMRIQRSYGTRPSLTVAIRLETIHALGKWRPFSAHGEAPITRFNAGVVSFTRQRAELGSLDDMEFGDTSELFLLNPPDNHIFRAGTEMKWITLGHRSPPATP
jgi:hypothetical protein